MKSTTKIVCCSALLFTAAISLADGPATRPAGPGTNLGPVPTTRPARRGPNLEALMKQMDEAYDGIREQVEDPAKNESTLKLINDFQVATMAAKQIIPGRVNRLAEAEKTKALADYRGMFVTLVRQELDLEEQITAGDNKAAQATLEKIEETEKKAHNEFRPRRQK